MVLLDFGDREVPRKRKTKFSDNLYLKAHGPSNASLTVIKKLFYFHIK
jgi:hypothetical protein